MKWRSIHIILLFLLMGGVFFLLELFLGPVKIPFSEIFRILTSPGEDDSSFYTIVMESRLPRALTAVVAGMGLAWSGWLMQTLFRNPLAGPSVLGISSGASLGVAILFLLGGSTMSLMGGASIVMAAVGGALAVLLLILFIAHRLADNMSLLLFGIMLGYFVSAIVSALQFKAASDALKAFVIWGMGSFSDADVMDTLWMLLAMIPAVLIVLMMLKPLNLLLLGDEYATSLGVNTRRVRMLIVLAVGLMIGAVTAFCGPVAFIGLVVPHIVRTWMHSSEHRRLFLPVGLAGIVCALGSDILSRTLELPLNAIVSALGAPVVIYIIVRGSKSKAII